MHDNWNVYGELEEVRRRIVDGDHTRKSIPIPADDLKHQIETLRTLIDDVINLADEFDRQPPALADMRRE